MQHENWLAFLREIKKAEDELGFKENEERFYRGHVQSDWKLSPGLLRDITPFKKNRITETVWEKESDLYYEFKSRARALHNQNMNDWDVLFTMQHYKVKTQLLDWTEMLGTAIYFALEKCSRDGKANGSTPCIWLMNPYVLNNLYHRSRELWDPEILDYYANKKGEYTYSDLLGVIHEDEDGDMFYWDEPIALYPLRKNDRLTNQGGYFTIHGNNVLPLEDIAPNDKDKFLRKIILPPEAIPSAFEFIDAAGINDFTMFPDLDGLAKYLNKKYFK